MRVEELFKYHVRIWQNEEQGSGLIYYPENLPYAVIISAKHVLNSTSIEGTQIDRIQGNGDQFHELHLDHKFGASILHSTNSDLAAIVLRKDILVGITGELPLLKSLNRQFDFKDSISIGYPGRNENQIKSIDSIIRSYNEDPPFEIISKTARLEDLQTLRSDSYDNIKGMSGGGLFYKERSNYYLAGILTRFKDNYKDFHSIDIAKVNELLESCNIPSLPVTYASKIGLNEEWFQEHIEKARRDLGDRYTQEIESFDVPQARIFVGIESSHELKELIRSVFHNYLKECNDKLFPFREDYLKEFNTYMQNFINELSQHYDAVRWNVPHLNEADLPIAIIEQYLHRLKETITIIEKEEDQYLEMKKKQGQEEDLRYRSTPFYRQKRTIWDLEESTNQFLHFFKAKLIGVAINPTLLITGKAGNGKSHLLGDIAYNRLLRKKPSIFVLGNQLRGNEEPWTQILNILSLPWTKTQLIEQLNSIGEFFNERLLFFVDALNEGNGKHFWIDFLEGFIEDFKKYPFLGLILSIRSTYIKTTIPQSLIESKRVVQMEHQGFQGVELEALRHFCNCFELEEPGIPLLSPEFTNPQFLLLICKSLREQGISKFPKGVNGVTQLYDFYIRSLNEKIIREQKYKVSEGVNIVKEAIKHLLKYRKSHLDRAKLAEIQKHFNSFEYCANGQDLLHDLIKYNLITEERAYVGNGEYDDIVKFTYERFAHYMEINELLNNHVDNVYNLFNDGGYIFDLFKNEGILDEGWMETLAVQLPEKFELEIHEVITADWQTHAHPVMDIVGMVASAWIESIIWRDYTSIDQEKSDRFIVDYLIPYGYLESLHKQLLIVASLEKHPLNGEYFHQRMLSFSLMQREGWLQHMLFQAFYDDSSPVSRLINWILDYEEHFRMSSRSRYLTSIVLSWFLSSSFRALRDSATLALIKLLTNHFNVLRDIINLFWTIDDAYICERLFAVVNGCVVRSNNIDEIRVTAEFIYELVFEKEKPPIDIMLRDYARGTIEYALFLNPDLKIDIRRVQPPYESQLPNLLPTLEEAENLRVGYHKDRDFDIRYQAISNNAVIYSLTGMDFDKDRIGWAIGKFACVSFVLEREFNNLQKGIKEEENELINRLIEVNKEIGNVMNKIRGGPSRWSKIQKPEDMDRLDEILSSGPSKEEIERFTQVWTEKKESLIEEHESIMETLATSVIEEDIQRIVLPFTLSVRKNSSYHLSTLSHKDYAPWIAFRVFELGYDPEICGHFDYHVHERRFRGEHSKYKGHLDRIGRKYEVIAGHELLARLADNYYIARDWSDKKPYPYMSPRDELSLDDIDPTSVQYIRPNEKYFIDEAPAVLRVPYDTWDVENWLNTTDDLPDVGSLIRCSFDCDKEWLCLYTNRSWKEMLPLGGKEYYAQQRKINYWLRSYIVKASIIPQLRKDFHSIKYSELNVSITEHYNIFEKEFYWSQLYQKKSNDENEFSDMFWRHIVHTKHRGIPTSELYNAGGGSYGLQDGHTVSKPNKFVVDNLKLRHTPIDGEMKNASGEVVCVSFNRVPFRNLYMWQSSLGEFLNNNGLTIIWILKGEKMDLHGHRDLERTHLQGLYVLTQDGRIDGQLHLKEKYDS